MPPRAAYIHVPFCRHRCGYCNFTVLAGRDELRETFLEALERELAWLQQPRAVDTLFLGGGTPTQLTAEQLARLLAIATRWFPLAAGYEFSVETNPSDLTADKLAVLESAGVTRISVGVQSFDAAKLSLLERDHTPAAVTAALDRCRGRFASVSLDLIFGVPHESLQTWRDDLEAALARQPQHLSTYGLTFEKGAAFWARRARGQLQAADEELERAMYLAAIDCLTAAGWEHYEVSNFAQPGHRCRHNLVYWMGGEYYAAGPGAARYVAGVREVNHRSTTTYLRKVLAGQSPVAEREQLDPVGRAREGLVFQLRMIEGLDLVRFADETGYSAQRLLEPGLSELLDLGLLELRGERLRLTRQGLLVSDAIWPRFLVPDR